MHMRYFMMSTIIAIALILTSIIPASAYLNEQEAIGGQISSVSFHDVISDTQRWQGYYGKVQGYVIFEGATENPMFEWDWTPTEGDQYHGFVYATVNPNDPDWANICQIENTALDVIYSFTDGTDRVVNTFIFKGSNVFANKVINDVAYAETLGVGGDSDWKTYILTDNGSVIIKNNVIFASTIMDASTNYDFMGNVGDTNYQMIVPKDPVETKVYYFYIDLSYSA